MFFGRRKKNCDKDYVSLKRLLVSAAGSGDLAEVKRLVVDCGIDPNIQDDIGDTPLHYAAEHGHLDVVKLLLEHGADPNIQNNSGKTPLHYAALDGHLEIVKFLLEHGANPNVQDYKFGVTPLHFAVYHCDVDMTRFLLDHGADPTIRDNEGRTPLDIGSECPEEFREMLRRRSGATTVYE